MHPGHPAPDHDGHLAGAGRRGVLRYALAAPAFGLLALYGMNALRQDAPAVGVPLVITGLAGALGAAVTCRRPESRAQWSVCVAMLLASAAVVVTGVVSAPDGEERGFVIGVATFLAVLLAAFAWAAVPRRA